MPTYEYRCECGRYFDRFLKLVDYAEPQECECSRIAEKIFTAPIVRPDLPAYQSPVDGRWVEGRVARQRDLARSGCVEYEPSLKEESQRDRIKQDAVLENKIEETVSKEIHKMSSSKRARLMAELESGANVEYKRLAPTGVPNASR